MANGTSLTIGSTNLTGVTTIAGTDGTGEHLVLKGVATFDLSGVTFTNLDSIKATNTEVQTIIAKGANKIDLGATSAATTLKYTNADQYGDTVTGYVKAQDKVVFADALTSKVATGALTFGTTTLNSLTQDGAFIDKATNTGGSAVNAATLATKASVATLLAAKVTVTDGAAGAAETNIFVVEASDTTGTFGVYSWTQSTNTDTTIDSAELTVVGVYTGDAAVPQADFTTV
jgi:hypothetical protein